MVVSIITVNFNNSDGLKQTLMSIDNQIYRDYELVIIDGGSTDGSKEVILNYIEDHKDTIWVSEKDNGIYNAMNKGVRKASGDYCIFMNSGDCFYDSNALKESIPFLTGTYSIVSGYGYLNDERHFPVSSNDISMSFFIKKSINHQATYILRSLLLDNPYNEEYRIVSDSLFFFKTLVLDNVSYKDIPVTVCKCEKPGLSSDLKSSLEERYIAIKSVLPKRMSSDVDFIIKYNNRFVVRIGDLLNTPLIRYIYSILKRLTNKN